MVCGCPQARFFCASSPHCQGILAWVVERGVSRVGDSGYGLTKPPAHGDADHGLEYKSPHLPKPLQIDLADPVVDEDRKLFSHYLWNSSLLLAELVESGTLGLEVERQAMNGVSVPPVS